MSTSERRHRKLSSEETGMCGGTCTKRQPSARALRRMLEEESYRKAQRKRAAVMKCSVNSKYRQHHEHTAARKSREGKTGRYPKCQPDPQVNCRKRLLSIDCRPHRGSVSGMLRLKEEEQKNNRSARAEHRPDRTTTMPSMHYTDKTHHTYTRDWIVLHVSVFPAGYWDGRQLHSLVGWHVEGISVMAACDHAAFVICTLPIPGQDRRRVAPWPGAAVLRPAQIVFMSSYLVASMAIHVYACSLKTRCNGHFCHPHNLNRHLAWHRLQVLITDTPGPIDTSKFICKVICMDAQWIMAEVRHTHAFFGNILYSPVLGKDESKPVNICFIKAFPDFLFNFAIYDTIMHFLWCLLGACPYRRQWPLWSTLELACNFAQYTSFRETAMTPNDRDVTIRQ